MSLLFRSLLALAAFLATAVAQRPNCSYVLIGRTSSQSVNDIPVVPVPPPGGQISVPDYCQYERNSGLVGEYVEVCNNDPNGSAPAVIPVDPNDPHKPVIVRCTDGCPSGTTARVVQYCSY